MANTLIQLKRSQNTANPTTLAEGELAYSGNSQSNALFIGLPDGSNTVTKIAGGKYGFLDNANTGNSTVAVIEGGKLTANAVLITDANSSINEIRTAKLIINTSGNTEFEATSITAFANAVQIGANSGGSNTELATTVAVKTYVDARTSAVGAALGNTQVAFSNGTVFVGSDAFTFDYSANTISIGGALEAGNTTITGFANITSTLASGNTTVTGFINVSSSATVAGPLSVTNTAALGNTTVTGFANISSTLAAGNTTVTGFANISSTLAAGNTTLTGFINVSSSAEIGSDLDVGGELTVTNTAALGNTTITGFANVTTTLAAGNTTITGFANVSGDVKVGADLSVTGNAALGTDTSDVISINGYVNTSIIPSANITYGLGTDNLRWGNSFFDKVTAANGEFDALTVSGDLTISGNVTSISVEVLQVDDPLIHLAANNETSDAVDIGFIGHYSDDGGVTKKHTGVFRDASSGEYYVFNNYVDAALDADPPTSNIIDVSNNTFQIATLHAYLESGALTSNTTVVTITANASIDVTITANDVTADSLTFTGVSGQDIFVANSSGGLTALSLGNEGQVLQSNGTALVYAGLDGGTF